MPATNLLDSIFFETAVKRISSTWRFHPELQLRTTRNKAATAQGSGLERHPPGMEFSKSALPANQSAGNNWLLGPFNRLTPERSCRMRQQRRPRTSVGAQLASAAPAPMHRASPSLPTSGYVLIVDGHIKNEFKTKEGAEKGARELKSRFPMLQIKVYNAEAKVSEEITLA